MLIVAIAGHPSVGLGSLKSWTIGGCAASACALMGPALAGLIGAGWSLRPLVFALGVANGAFAIGAIGTMMAISGSGGGKREGVRMGLWGASQAIAFGIGGFIGAACVDVLRHVVPSPGMAYTITFAIEAVLFVAAAVLAQTAIPDAGERSEDLIDMDRGYAVDFG
jgi:BCD family chlorophyll transporter-like MFS transporter